MAAGRRRAPVHSCTLAALILSLPLGAYEPAWGYRPFVSTDAAVADPGVVEIELGYFQVARQPNETIFSVPKLVLNYGLVDRLEIVGEFAIQQAPHQHWHLVDPGLSVKGILKEGVLQEKPGLSIAMEIGSLLPSTALGETGVGFSATAIVSGELSRVTYHVNIAGGVDRAASRPFATWGLIVEVPLAPSFRLVAEVNGERVAEARPANSALLGFIWHPFPARALLVDGGVRRGLMRAAPDWQATLGVTFSSPVKPGARR